jgi:hypothetical protein
MRMTSALPARAYTAPTLDDMRRRAEALRDSESLEAIAPLVLLDRQAPGWLAPAGSWLARALALLAAILFLLAFLLGCCALGALMAARLVADVYPGWGLVSAALLLAIAAPLLWRDTRVRGGIALLRGPAPARLWRPAAAAVWVLRLVMIAVVACWASLYLILALFPMMFALILLIRWPAPAIDRLGLAGGSLLAAGAQALLVVGLAALLLLALVYAQRAWAGRAILALIGVWAMLAYPWRADTTAIAPVIVAAAFLWVRGGSSPLAEPLNDQLRGLLAKAHRLDKQLALRRLIAGAADAQQRRNRAAAGGDWRLAVCRNCLARFEARSVRLGVVRRLELARCPGCHSDSACYAGVRRVEGWLGLPMPDAQQSGPLLMVELTSRLLAPGRCFPPALDTIVVARASDELVERFVIAYRERQHMAGLSPLKRLDCRVEPGTPLGENTRRMLRAAFRSVSLSAGRRTFEPR